MKTKRLAAVAILSCVLASASLVGAQTLQTLVSFNGSNGAYPLAGLTLGNDGNFYGTTVGGGSNDDGTIFQVTTNGTLTTLYSFTGGSNSYHTSAALTLGSDGNFYGTTSSGGSGSVGTVFKVTTNGVLTALVSFNQTNGEYPYPNGEYPKAALTLGSDGNFYGTTSSGGSGGGTVFKVTTNGTLTTLASFMALGYGGNGGEDPEAALTLGTDGNFYGTTEAGGSSVVGGTVFKVTTNGTLTTLVSFAITNGEAPNAALTLRPDGNFYGTTSAGGDNGNGTVFKVTTNGTLTTLVLFNGSNGSGSLAALTLGTDGNFYGTTEEGGTNGYGTIFRVTTNGTLTTLVSFNGSNGAFPRAALTLGTDGNFYGTIYKGGSVGLGTVFRLVLPPVVPPTLAFQFVAGCPQLNLAGMLNNNFVVQYSTNLAGTNWMNLLCVTNLSASPYEFQDPAGAGQPARFYRAFMQ
jgi:uncharacterized repeat protein (TIGR03803 family)